MFKKLLSVFLMGMVTAGASLGSFAMTDAKLQTVKPDSALTGNLVIVGGALKPSNAAVYNAFINAAGGPEKAKIGIIPAASGSLSSSKAFKADLIRYGLTEAQVQIVPITITDDTSTKDVDESKWVANSTDAKIAQSIQTCTGIWFVGGDQTKVTKALIQKDGSQSPALKSIWQVYQSGGVLGGTSAGAAIMSQPMLAGGNSLGAFNQGLTYKDPSASEAINTPVYLENGLGFFQYGLVDQHFDARSRLGRLAVAGYEYKAAYKRAFGIDENTAMVFNASTKGFEVVGEGGISVLDFSMATKKAVGKQYAYDKLLLSYLSSGDQFNVETGVAKIVKSKDSTIGYEYYETKGNIVNSGLFNGDADIKGFIMYNLIDNAGAKAITAYAFDDKGLGAKVIFSKDKNTLGWWESMPDNQESYSAQNIIMKIEPISVKITPIK